jgi:hypothetical protein
MRNLGRNAHRKQHGAWLKAAAAARCARTCHHASLAHRYEQSFCFERCEANIRGVPQTRWPLNSCVHHGRFTWTIHNNA